VAARAAQAASTRPARSSSLPMAGRFEGVGMSEEFFITEVHIHKVRHIEDLKINLSTTERKHLILTGRNGSGKTSVLEALRRCIPSADADLIVDAARLLAKSAPKLGGIALSLNSDGKEGDSLREIPFVVEYFEAKRQQDFISPRGPKNLEEIRKENPDISESGLFVQFLVNLWMERLIAKDEQDDSTVLKIESWFENFKGKLRDIANDPAIDLQFDRKDWNFNIIEPGKNAYNLLQLSDGYSSILRIISQLIMRMEATGKWSFETQGIVLIDEIETHLHIELQEEVFPFLTSFFPNIQFIISTHSPFVLNSVKNAVICDLEKRIVVEDLSQYSSQAIAKAYFDADDYSEQLQQDVAEYEGLLSNTQLDLLGRDRLAELEEQLSHVPDFFSDSLQIKLQQIKLKYKRKIA
jgi:predicted ATPase